MLKDWEGHFIQYFQPVHHLWRKLIIKICNATPTCILIVSLLYHKKATDCTIKKATDEQTIFSDYLNSLQWPHACQITIKCRNYGVLHDQAILSDPTMILPRMIYTTFVYNQSLVTGNWYWDLRNRGLAIYYGIRLKVYEPILICRLR